MLSRRRFLGIAGGAAEVAAGGVLGWETLLNDHLDGHTTDQQGSGVAKRVLVIVQMSGGNDGVNTLIPAGDGRYFDARPTVAIKEADVVALAGTDRYGLHPKLAPLVPLWQQGHLAAIDGIGFPDQTRSHFSALDTWWSATPDEPIRTGWLGRWMDATGDGTNPLRAVALGGGSPALVGERAVSTVVLDPAGFALRTPRDADGDAIRNAFLATAAPLSADPMGAAAQQAIPATLQAVDLLAKASEAPSDTAGQADSTSITGLLTTAAGIIDLQLGTEIILVAGNGFDTHSDQTRRHSDLLEDLAGGITGFLETLTSRGQADDVLVITTSEFGRRVQENGSGTDHGNGSVHFLAGPMVADGQVVGQADLGDLVDGDLRSSIDSRSLYANALDWLSGPTGPTDDVLGQHADRYSLVTV